MAEFEVEIEKMIRESQKEQDKVVAKGFNHSMFIEGYIQALKAVLEMLKEKKE
jgi:nitrogenase molybdenum-iron protein alpha/beta subunit